MTDKGAEAGSKRWQRKEKYKAKFEKLVAEYKNALVVGVDNVGSLQMQKIRIAVRGKAVLIMGKNTLMRMILREQIASNPKLEALLPFVRGNMGLIFTNSDLKQVRTVVTEFKQPAPAKTGTFAPTDCFVPAGPTGLDPGQTAFFQALAIPTKIVKGAIEIINQVHLIKKGDKVTASAVALLAKLDIKPFFYGVTVSQVYENGAVYPAHVLDISDADLQAKFFGGVQRITALSLSIGWASSLTLPLYMASAFRKLLSLSQATTYTFAQGDAFFKNAKPVAGGGGGGGGGAAAAKDDGGKKGGDKGGDKGGKGKGEEKPKKEEPKEEEEEEGGIGMDLFG